MLIIVFHKLCFKFIKRINIQWRQLTKHLQPLQLIAIVLILAFMCSRIVTTIDAANKTIYNRDNNNKNNTSCCYILLVEFLQQLKQINKMDK